MRSGRREVVLNYGFDITCRPLSSFGLHEMSAKDETSFESVLEKTEIVIKIEMHPKVFDFGVHVFFGSMILVR